MRLACVADIYDEPRHETPLSPNETPPLSAGHHDRWMGSGDSQLLQGADSQTNEDNDVSTKSLLCRMLKMAETPNSFKDAYAAGYDCGMYGSNTRNSDFRWFKSPVMTKDWERGKRDGEKFATPSQPTP